MDSFGFHSTNSKIFEENDDTFSEFYTGLQNVLNVLGWFPFVGTVIGIIRFTSTIILFIEDENAHNHKKFYLLSTIRSVIEFFSLGWFYVIPDIYFTVIRRKKKSKKSKKNKKGEKN
jgi:hypothetical protein